MISGSNEVAFPEVKLEPGVVALGQLSGFEGVTCQLYTLVLEQPGRLDKLSKVTVVGTQPVVALAVKSAITSGLTQMVLVSEVIPQLFAPDVKIVIEYVPGVLNVIFKVLVAVDVQMDGLFGKVPLKPKFPTTVT